MSFAICPSPGSEGREEPADLEPSRPSSNGRRTGSVRHLDGLEPFAVEVRRVDGVTIVQPRGELDVATIETLRAALDSLETAGRLVLDLRGLSFMDSTGLHLLVELYERAQRDGFQLTLRAPAAPVDRAISLCSLYEVLPFAPAVDGEPVV